MSTTDLHMHTTFSDGSLSPEELVTKAKNEGFSLIAITDHDTIGGVTEARDAGRKIGVEVIPGLEISAEYGPGTMHILAYGFDPKNEPLGHTLVDLQRYRAERNPRIAAILCDLGYDVDYEEVKKLAGGNMVGRPHFARLLINKGYFDNTQEIFDKLLAKDMPAYLPKRRLDPKKAMELINAAGGKAVLAHPESLKLDDSGLESLVKELASFGLGGIEVDYNNHGDQSSQKFRKLAAKFNLFVTGGSDFHGETKPHVKLGQGVSLTAAEVAALKNQL